MPSPTRQMPPRRADLLSQEVDGEYVVVDEVSEQAHQLSGDIATVWRASGEGVWPELPDTQVTEIVAELVALGLLQETEGVTRRAVIQRGGAVVALAGLITIGLPEAAAFASMNVLTTLTFGSANTNPTPGSVVTFTGTLKRTVGAAPVSGVTINFTNAGGTTVGSAVTLADGSFSGTVSMPLTGQQYVVKATSVADGTYAASNTVQVTEFVTKLTSTSTLNKGGSPKTLVVSGAGYASISVLSFTSSEGTATVTPPVTTDATGAFGSTNVVATYPSGSTTYTLTVKDASNNTASISFPHAT